MIFISQWWSLTSNDVSHDVSGSHNVYITGYRPRKQLLLSYGETSHHTSLKRHISLKTSNIFRQHHLRAENWRWDCGKMKMKGYNWKLKSYFSFLHSKKRSVRFLVVLSSSCLWLTSVGKTDSEILGLSKRTLTKSPNPFSLFVAT